MAFNPFHHFRRFNKVVFAALAIICMLTFVLSSGLGGRGDFFTTITEWATNRRHSTALLTLYGKEYDAGQVQQVQNRRRLASEYMESAVFSAQRNLNERVMKGLNKLEQNSQRMVFDIVITRSQYQMSNALERYIREQLPRHLQLLNLLIFQADNQRDKNPEPVAILGDLRKMLSLDLYRLAGRKPGDLYYGGSYRSTEDTLDFLLWMHQADQFGIKLTDDDINYAITSETLRELTPNDAADIDRGLRSVFKGGYSKEALFGALGDELRVRMTQVALTGSTATGGMHTRTAIPVFLTPQEYWEMFKDARTTVKVGLINVPTENFLSQVTAEPKEDELKALFDKYKNDEAAPERADPGFKEPRRVQVEWVGVAPDLPFYKKAADQLSPLLPALRILGFTEAASTLNTALTLDAEFLDQERYYRMREIPWTDNSTPHIHATSYLRPENIASMVGAAIGSPNTGGTLLSSPLMMEGAAFVREVQDRTIVGGSRILTAAIEPAPLGVFGLPTEVTPEVKLAQIQGTLKDKAKESLLNGSQFVPGSGLIKNDLTTFRTDVTKKGKESDRAVVRKLIDEFVQAHGLLRGATTAPRDQYALVNDSGMSPLKEAYQRVRGQQDYLLRGFANDFFADRLYQSDTPIDLYTPQEFITSRGPQGEDKTFLFWRTEDIPARTPAYAKARPEVVEAWKRLQARDLAKKAADRLSDLAKQDQGDAQKLRDLAAQQENRDYFELGPMARKMVVPSVQPGYGQQYQDPTIPPEKIAYPGDEFLKRLLGLRNDPKGTTIVVADIPQLHFYVLALLQRDEPTQEEFRKVYANSMSRAVDSDSLLAELSNDRVAQYRKDVLKQLHVEGNASINEDARKRAGDDGTDG